MAMGKRRRHAKQTSMWVATPDLIVMHIGGREVVLTTGC
jgi:hypothetical protein